MRRFTWLSVVVVVPLLGLCARPARAQQEQSGAGQKSTGDSLADAARKARERKKEAPKPKHVYTDDDVATIQSAPVNVLGAPPSSAAETSAQSKGNAGAGQQAGSQAKTSGPQESEETKWRKRFKEVRDNLARAEKQLEVLQREDNKAQVQYYSDPQKALTEQYSRQDINDKNAKIAAKQQEIQQLKQQLNDLEDQLRKAGGDPGWAQ